MDSFNRRQMCRVKVDPEDEIVISGIAGRFPKSHNVAEFSHNLFNKIDMVDSNKSRFKHYNADIPDRNGLTYNIDKFDATFFSLNHRSAMFTDPQQRMLQEHAYEAIVDAGMCPKQLRGSRTAVFVGCCSVEADNYILNNDVVKDSVAMHGSARSLLANRISFSLDFKGPSIMIDTACSSAGYALDLAFNAIRNGECEAAIVGGSNLIIDLPQSVQFSRLGVLAMDGVCRPFDDDSHGYVRSESVSTLFLQKRKDAKRVYATVLHSKTNVDGFKNEGISYPSAELQSQLFTELYQEIGIHPETIKYIESHGTGTRVGDPEECKSIDKVFCAQRTEPLSIGSLKSNMGHAEAAASNCSVIKSILIFENGKIPPMLHFKKPRQDIPSLVAGRLKPVTELQEFNGGLIGVNSFGFGGANSHILLKQHTKDKVNNGIPTDNIPRILVWSGRTEEALNTIFDNLTQQPIDAEYFGLLQNTQVSTQSSNTYRGYAIYTQDSVPSNAVCAVRHIENFSDTKRPVVWVFSGMGSQWPGMGADLMKIPIFEASIRRSHEVLAKKGIDLINIITSKDPTIFDNILHSFVGISAIQIALTNVLKAIGLEPDYIIGHSFGELGCAYADNCLTDEEMILASYSRGLVSIESDTIYGTMATVELGYKAIMPILDDGLYVACRNSANSCTISGPVDIVTQFMEKLKSQNIFAKELQCSNIAYHSPYINDLGPVLTNHLMSIIKAPKERSEKWISTSVPKTEWTTIDGKYSSSQYHTNNLLNSVLFEESCEYLPKNSLTIEIAPHGLLQSITKSNLPDGIHISLTKRDTSEASMLLYSTLGKLFENGIDMDVSKLYPSIKYPVSRGTPMISPLIKWNHDETYFVSAYGTKNTNEKVYDLSDAEFEFITDHDIDGRQLFPATGYLYLAWKTLAVQLRKNFATFDVEFEDVKYIRACQIQKNRDQKLTVIIQPETGQFQVSEDNLTLVTGIVRPCPADIKLTEIDDADPNDEVVTLDSANFYKELRIRGYHYKGLFKSVVSAKIDSTRGYVKWHSNWIAFLDCVLQTQIVRKDTRSMVVPIEFRKFIIKKTEHEKVMTKLGDNPIFETKFCPYLNVSRCGGVEISGLVTTGISRRPKTGLPVLESHQFVPHFPTPCFSLLDVGRFCVELAIENINVGKVFCIEIDMRDDKEPLCEYFGQALNNLPVITSELTYLTSKDIEIPQTTVSSTELSAFSDQTFVIRSNCLFDADFLENVKKYLSDNAYVISRESKNCEVYHDYEGSQGYKIVAIIPTETETLILMQYKKVQQPQPTSIIKITNTDRNYTWLDVLKKSAKTEPTIIYAEHENQSGIIGLANCIQKEPGGHNLRCVFIDDKSAPPFNIDDPFYKAQLNKDLAINIYRNGKWGSMKHFLVNPIYDAQPYEDSCYGNYLVQGDLSSLRWIQSSTLINTDNVVRVQCVGIIFRDVMLAAGKLTADLICDNRKQLMCMIGYEFAGVTKTGRRVMGFKYAGSLASHIDVKGTILWDAPDFWTLEEAVTIPSVYSTVYTAFFITTKIKKGKSILIHAGCGGVGLAAIRVTLAYGLEVFTTVSTDEKRNYLLSEYPELKPENIGNSRDTSFEGMIKKQTRGKGVDYVLNSLSEEKLLASFRCLGKNGHFLEIGKFDFSVDNKLGLRDFMKELSFSSIMGDTIFKKSDEEKMKLIKLVQDDIERGIVKPLRRTIFNADKIENAFRYMASGKHIGKVILKLRENETDKATLPISVIPKVHCNPKHSYIICGGLGGFGLELADWLILRGCDNLILSTSRGITKQYQAYKIKLWESYGVRVQVNKSDITTRQGCVQLINDAIKLGPVGGIFNLALQLRDSILDNQTVTTFDECMAPKAYATKYLDEISRSKCPNLKYFVVFSSVSCGRGNAGQSNYGMANSVMERLIEERHNLGLPAKAIQWGAIGDVGIVADLQENNIDFEIGGTLLQGISSCLEELETLITYESPIVSSMVVAEKRIRVSGKGNVVEMLMNIMSIKDVKSVSLETKLSELGMDSLMTVEISHALERDFNITLTPPQLRSMTVAQLKALEGSGDKKEEILEKSKIQSLNSEVLVRYLGDEGTSHLNIIKLNDQLDDGSTKVLVFPGLEGICGKLFYYFASQLKYPSYLLQCMNIRDIRNINDMCDELFKDVAKLYENVSSFVFVGYAYGSILTLKLAKMLENLGKTGKVIIVDGSPSLYKQIIQNVVKDPENVDEIIQKITLDQTLKLAFANDTSNRKQNVLAELTWNDKLKKLDELYDDSELCSKEYLLKFLTLVKNRIMAGFKLTLDDFPSLKSPIRLVKPTEMLVFCKDNDYGLKGFSEVEIDVKILEGNHLTVFQHRDFCHIINSF